MRLTRFLPRNGVAPRKTKIKPPTATGPGRDTRHSSAGDQERAKVGAGRQRQRHFSTAYTGKVPTQAVTRAGTRRQPTGTPVEGPMGQRVAKSPYARRAVKTRFRMRGFLWPGQGNRKFSRHGKPVARRVDAQHIAPRFAITRHSQDGGLHSFFAGYDPTRRGAAQTLLIAPGDLGGMDDG